MENSRRFTLLLAGLMVATNAVADTLLGRVVGVSDGDTITVLDASNHQHKIRLTGIDAPERKQPFGEKSKLALSSLVYEKKVTVEYRKVDRYDRKIGKILVGGVDANLEQVAAGMAWHYKKYQNEQAVEDRLIYAEAEERAKVGRRGLWANDNSVPPWDWRKLKRR